MSGGRVLLAILLVSFCMQIVRAQARKCDSEDGGCKARSVTVEARWLPKLDLPLKRGDEVTTQKLSDARNALRNEINKELDKNKSDYVNLGMTPIVELNFIWVSLREVPAATCLAEGLTDKCVDVVIHPLTLSVDTLSVGTNLLPLPRSNKLSFLSNVPSGLRILNPKFGFIYDRRLGATPKVDLSTDLLSVGKLLDHKSGSGKTALILSAKGSKSIDEPFYKSQVGLSLSFRQPSKQIQSAEIDAKFTADSEPEREARHLKNSFKVGGNVDFNPSWGILNRIFLAGGYRRSSNRLQSSQLQKVIRTKENSFDGRVVLEGRIFNGFARFGAWFERSHPVSVEKAYDREALLFGYEKEVPAGSHTIGVEALLGAGRASKITPEYARFFGGNTLMNFLIDDVSDPSLAGFPSGPILRSFGKNQAATSGGSSLQLGATSYQHFNLSISIPIPKLSYPLIPDEVVDEDPGGDKLTLRKLIKNATDQGEVLLSGYFQEEGLDDDVANKKAAEIFREVTPGVNYLADFAKVYAIKPLLLFDEARLQRTGVSGHQTRYAIGGGVQLLVTLVKFECGYMRTVHMFPGDQKGAFFTRLSFLNIF